MYVAVHNDQPRPRGLAFSNETRQAASSIMRCNGLNKTRNHIYYRLCHELICMEMSNPYAAQDDMIERGLERVVNSYRHLKEVDLYFYDSALYS